MINSQLREHLKEQHLVDSQATIAKKLKVSNKTVNNVLNGKAPNTSKSKMIEEYILKEAERKLARKDAVISRLLDLSNK